ncbi:hypothetical protein OROMI_020434 [Orobanche minor]
MKVESRANLVPRLMVGKYTFCCLAAMVLINEVHRLDFPRLIDWIVFRQGVEGGFQGRTNKLVVAVISFGSCSRDDFHHPESLAAIGRDFIVSKRTMKPIFNSIRLQRYFLLCHRRRQASEINLRSVEITTTPATA